MNAPVGLSYCSDMTNAPQMDGQVAVVTGGSRGIGLAVASLLVEQGARVVIAGRDPERLASASNGLEALHPDGASRVVRARVDVRDPAQAGELMALAETRFGGLDVLINNAGVGIFGDAADLTVEQWQRVMETNLHGVFYCCHAAIPHLRRRGGGWIVNVSSLASKNPFRGGAAYCASKAGLNALSEVLMQELRYDDIRVSYILPGSVDTDFSRAGRGAAWKLSADDVGRAVLDILTHDRRSLPSRVEIRPSKPVR